MWWKLPSPSTFLPALRAARPAGARLPLCFSLCLLCTPLSFQPPTCARKSLLPRQLLDMRCPHSRFPRPFPVREIPHLPLHPGSPSPDVPSPQLVWSHKPKRAWGCPRLCSLFHTLGGKLQDKWTTEAFHLPQPGRPQVSLMNALTIWSSVFSIRLQEVFLAPSLPCLPSLRLHLGAL